MKLPTEEDFKGESVPIDWGKISVPIDWGKIHEEQMELQKKKEQEEHDKHHKTKMECKICKCVLVKQPVYEPFTVHTVIGGPVSIAGYNIYCPECGLKYVELN